MRQSAEPAAERGLAPSRHRWAVVLVSLCVFVTLMTFWIGRNRDFVRNPDEAAYAEQASSLLEDGTLTVGFARHYHVQYPPEIDHPEDFYPPGNGALIAGCWALFGRSDFVSTLPSIVLAGLVLPLLTYLLARKLHATPPFAFGCAVSVLLDLEFRFHAFQALADLPLCAAVVGSIVVGMQRPAWCAPIAGLLLGVGFWFKPTALLFAPGIALAIMLADRRPLAKTALRIASFGVVMALVCTPWLVRNEQVFGDPLYSGNKHLSATANAPGFRYTDTRKVYWADAEYELPALEDSIERFGIRPVLRRFLAHLYELVVDHGAVAFGGVFMLAALTMILHRRVFAVLVVIASFCLALSAVFAIFYRYLLPIFPMIAAVTWTFIDRVTRRVLRAPGTPLVRVQLATPGRLAVLIAVIAALPGGAQFTRNLVLGKSDFAPNSEAPIHQAAEWARDHLAADARVMTTEALTFRHISGRRSVNTPWDKPEAMDAVIEHHHIGYLIVPDSGQFSEVTVTFLGPYLDRYRERWQRFDVSPTARFTVYVRDGAPLPN